MKEEPIAPNEQVNDLIVNDVGASLDEIADANEAIELNADEIPLIDPQKSRIAQAYRDAQNLTPTELIEEADLPPPATPNSPDYKELALRTAAEFDNYRKRVARERADWQRDVLARFLQNFLTPFDDLDRTLLESEKTADVATICAGVKLARENLWGVMEKAGVKTIDAVGQKFDPHFHEALSMIPLANAAPNTAPNTVIEVFQPGYLIGDFVLRPARVVVAGEAG